MIKFIIESYSFKRIVLITLAFIGLTFIVSKLFDKAWGTRSYIPIINLEDVYKAPAWYDNFPEVNLKLTDKEKVCLEGNTKFKLADSQKDFNYYDTAFIKYPENTFEHTTKILLLFEGKETPDSISIVVSKSDDPKIFYKQVFYSSIKVNELNELSKNPAEFRTKKGNLVSDSLLKNNDTLINMAIKFFNENKDSLGLAECGTNSEIFKKICYDYNLPCRIISLQGGDADQSGYYNNIGYPLHVVCEIYSSKQNKWYVIDPSFGFRFRQKNSAEYLNAVEISQKYIFGRENDIEQDSILFTKRTVVGRDYFKFYENIFYKLGFEYSLLRKVFRVFFPEFNYHTYHYSNNYPPVKNGFNYIGIKTFMYFFLLIVYINSIMFIFINRLIKVKRPKTSEL